MPDTLDSYENLKDKTVVICCTSGSRCEKAPALMVECGFKNIYQLDVGIISYAQAFPEVAFGGECFVFGERMSVAFTNSPAQIGNCHFCSRVTNEYTDCDNPKCNDLILICKICELSGRTLCTSCASTRVNYT